LRTTADTQTLPGGDIDRIAMHVLAIGDGITDIDPHPKANAALRWLTVVELGNAGLYFHREAHGRQYAGELQHQGITSGAVEPAAIASKRGIDQDASQPDEPSGGAGYIVSNQTAVAHHVGMHKGRQSSRLSNTDHR